MNLSARNFLNNKDIFNFDNQQKVANAFAHFFSSVYEEPTHISTNQNFGNFSFKKITEEDVKLSIQKLKPKKSVGTDNMPSFILKGCGHIFLRPLSHIFNLLVKTNTYPSVFKKSLITPIFKSGSNADVKNYRPICILNTLAKIFEKILQADIMSKCNDSFSINQHGFLPDKSTVTNLCTSTTHKQKTAARCHYD